MVKLLLRSFKFGMGIHIQLVKSLSFVGYNNSHCILMILNQSIFCLPSLIFLTLFLQLCLLVSISLILKFFLKLFDDFFLNMLFHKIWKVLQNLADKHVVIDW